MKTYSSGANDVGTFCRNTHDKAENIVGRMHMFRRKLFEECGTVPCTCMYVWSMPYDGHKRALLES